MTIYHNIGDKVNHFYSFYYNISYNCCFFDFFSTVLFSNSPYNSSFLISFLLMIDTYVNLYFDDISSFYMLKSHQTFRKMFAVLINLLPLQPAFFSALRKGSNTKINKILI
jgi:hypothetical protein